MKPKRSYESDLKESELFLLDFLATLGSATALTMSEELYSTHMNISYSHHLNLEKTKSVLKALLNKKLVTRKFSEEVVYDFDYETQKQTSRRLEDFVYSITEKGGTIWSIERTPIWEKFCCDSQGSYSSDDNHLFIDVAGTSKSVALEAIKYFNKSKVHNLKIETLEFIENPEYLLLHWKKFQNECAWRASMNSDCYPNMNLEEFKQMWRDFDQDRPFWRSLSELQKFL